MRHHRIHIPRARIVGTEVPLETEEAQYLRRVLRLSPGDRLEVFDGEGGVHEAEVTSLGGGEAALSVGPRREGLPPPPPFALLQGLAKGDKLEDVIQHATELGVTEVRPVDCERSVVRLDANKAARRSERWRRIAAEAARQCGRADVPVVHPPAPLLDAAREVDPGWRRWVAWESGGERIDVDARASGHALVVGPEGGLTGSEVDALVSLGFTPVHLGARVLRTETAALAVLSVVRYVQGQLG